MSEYKVSRMAGQALVPIVSKSLVVEVNGNFLARKTVKAQIVGVSGNFMRSARILDMTKPLQVARVVGQVIVPVVVDTTVTEVGVLVLRSQQDRVIPDATGAVLQVRIA